MQQINFAANTAASEGIRIVKGVVVSAREMADNSAAFWADSSLQELSIKSGIAVSGDWYHLDPSTPWVRVLLRLGCTVAFDGKKITIEYCLPLRGWGTSGVCIYTYLGNDNDWDYFENLGHLFSDIEKFKYMP